MDPALPPELLRRWMGDDHVPGPGREAVHEIAAALREAVAALVTVDAEGADPEALAPLTERIADVTAVLRGQPDLSARGGAAASPPPASFLPERSPVSGRTNPVAPPVTYEYLHGRTVAHAVYDAQHEGPSGSVHGGIVAATFDELLGIAQMHAGAAGFTGELGVRFHRTTPLHRPIRYEAWVERREGRKLLLRAHSSDGERLLAESWGTFVIQQELSTDEDDPATQVAS